MLSLDRDTDIIASMVYMGAIGRAYWSKFCITIDHEWVSSAEGAKKAHVVKLSHGLFTLYSYIYTI